MKKSTAAGLVICSTLSACAGGTGILPMGPNTYTLTEHVPPIGGGGNEAQRIVLTEANDFCAHQGRQLIPVIMGPQGDSSPPFGPTSYAMTFKCLLPNDPAVAQFQVQRAPDAIIEQRRQ